MGTTYLLDGLPLIPVVLGLFSLPELVSLAVSNRSISDVPRQDVKGGIWAGVRDSFVHWWLLLRSSVIGIYIGILPALGPTIADWVAYGHAVQSAKDKSQFGKGDIRGVIAPEAANNSVKGGDLVPTVAFGIPGSAAMAILLGAFLIQGLTPGPEMLTTKLHITFSMMWTLIIANIIAAIVLMAWANQLQKIIFIPAQLVLPGIIFFVLIGAWTAGNNIGDWITLLLFGVIGVVMKNAGWPRAPLVLGFILGRIMENSLHLSMAAYGIGFILRPICIVIALAIIVTICLCGALAPAAQGRIRRRWTRPMQMPAIPGVSLGLALAVGAVLIYAIAASFQWPARVRLFPLVFSIPALVLAAFAAFYDWRAVKTAPVAATPGGQVTVPGFGSVSREVLQGAHFFAWLGGVLAVTVLFGQHVALPLFIALYLLVWGKYRWPVALGYAAVASA